MPFADGIELGTIGLLNMDEAELGRLGEKGAGENREGMGDRLRELGWLLISIEMLYSSRFFSSAIAGSRGRSGSGHGESEAE